MACFVFFPPALGLFPAWFSLWVFFRFGLGFRFRGSVSGFPFGVADRMCVVSAPAKRTRAHYQHQSGEDANQKLGLTRG